MIEHKLIRVEDNDPNRCQGSFKGGQCPYRAHLDSEFCLRCGGNKLEESNKKVSLRNYRLNQYQARVGEFADNDQIKSVREEIGVLRMVLETTINKCGNINELLMYTPKISELVMKIEKLVLSCDRLERASGELLSKAKVLQLTGRIIDVISEHITDEPTLSAIGDDILIALNKTVGEPDEAKAR